MKKMKYITRRIILKLTIHINIHIDEYFNYEFSN